MKTLQYTSVSACVNTVFTLKYRFIHIGSRGDRGSLGQKIHFTAYFYYELTIWNTQYICLYLYIISTFKAI